MTCTYFISDLHLSEDRPDITACFTRFLADTAPKADALYILGDLFELWIGDDDETPFTQTIAEAINRLSKHTPVYFIHGNRDFLIRDHYAQRAGFALLPERCVVDLYGTPTLIMHGDELCTRDIAYQKFRKKARGWWWPKLMLMLPLHTRRNIAAKGRVTSKKNQSNLSLEIMDVTPEEVSRAMEGAGVLRLIHGHTHRPDIHELQINNQAGQRIVLGDWYEQGSVLTVTPHQTTLEQYTFTSQDN